MATKGPKRRRIADRAWDSVDRRGPNECWPWTGATNGYGYGHIAKGGKGSGAVAAHRVIYEDMIGTIPDGLVIDHLCRNRLCCNPAHLEPVTQRENNRRGLSPSMVVHLSGSCARGHDRTTHGYARKDRPGSFNCKACVRELRAQKR